MFKRKNAWNITKADLLNLPQPTFGRQLGEFLDENNFELIPKVERHDCYHVLCGYNTKVEDEIALQCLCYGNGKRSPYLYGAMILGVAILPDYYNYYYKSYKTGKRANAFHHFDYKKLLNVSITDLRTAIFRSLNYQNLISLTHEKLKIIALLIVIISFGVFCTYHWMSFKTKTSFMMISVRFLKIKSDFF